MNISLKLVQYAKRVLTKGHGIEYYLDIRQGDSFQREKFLRKNKKENYNNPFEMH